MDRRQLLKALGSSGIVGLAGCTSLVRGGDGNGSLVRGGDGNGSLGLKRRIAIAGQDSVPETYDVTIEATVDQATSTKQHPATVRITATNTGPKRQIGIGTGRCGLFNRSHGGSSPAGLWLHLTGEDAPRHRDDRWESPRRASQQRGYAAYGCGYGPFSAGESRTTTYGVWSDYQVQTYLEPGTYRFQRGDVVIEDAASRTATTTSTSTIEWGFSLELSPLDHEER